MSQKKEYQKYLATKEEREKARQGIIGSEEKPDTIKYLEKRLKYIDEDLSHEIKDKYEDRLSISEEIFLKKLIFMGFPSLIKVVVTPGINLTYKSLLTNTQTGEVLWQATMPPDSRFDTDMESFGSSASSVVIVASFFIVVGLMFLIFYYEKS